VHFKLTSNEATATKLGLELNLGCTCTSHRATMLFRPKCQYQRQKSRSMVIQCHYQFLPMPTRVHISD